jgi:hypothetical protein
VLVILALCESDRLKLIFSDALLFEIGHIPDQGREDDALEVLKIAKEALDLTPEIQNLVRKLEASGLQTLDTLHLAFASDSKVDYFCTCDDNFWKNVKSFSGLNIKVSIGRGDYTKERGNWIGEITLDDTISQIKAGKNKAQSVT